MKNSPELISLTEAAKMLNKKPSTLRAWKCRKKFLNPFKVGGGVMYDRREILSFIGQSRCELAPQGS